MNRAELLTALQAVQQTWLHYAQSLPLETYYQPLAPGRWSPAQHVQHLILTHRRVKFGLSVPQVLLQLRFGRPPRQRNYLQLRDDYRAALSAGGQSPSKYVPAAEASPSETTRAADLQEYQAALTDLQAAVQRWADKSLDVYAMPHDLLGRLSVREMLYFTLYHNEHHLSVVKAALENA